STVLVRVPLRELAPSRPTGSWRSYPRCSLISASRAVSSTVLVNPVNNPPGPTSSTPSARACSTSCAANCCASISFGTDSIISVTACPSRQAELGVSSQVSYTLDQTVPSQQIAHSAYWEYAATSVGLAAGLVARWAGSNPVDLPACSSR